MICAWANIATYLFQLHSAPKLSKSIPAIAKNHVRFFKMDGNSDSNTVVPTNSIRCNRTQVELPLAKAESKYLAIVLALGLFNQ